MPTTTLAKYLKDIFRQLDILPKKWEKNRTKTEKHFVEFHQQIFIRYIKGWWHTHRHKEHRRSRSLRNYVNRMRKDLYFACMVSVCACGHSSGRCHHTHLHSHMKSGIHVQHISKKKVCQRNLLTLSDVGPCRVVS